MKRKTRESNPYRCDPGKLSGLLRYHYASLPMSARGLEPLKSLLRTNALQALAVAAVPSTQKRRAQESNPLGCYTRHFSRVRPTVRLLSEGSIA